jgi:hypothetical protein
MKFNTVLKKSVFVITFFVLAANGIAGDKNTGSPEKPYMKEAERLLQKRNAIFNLDLDIQIGVGVANTSFELNTFDSTTKDLEAPKTKVGPVIGAILSLDFLGYGFTTGFQYTNKGFKNAEGEKTNLNYFNIPLLFYFDFNVGNKARIDGNLGPYFGLLLSDSDDPRYKVKNFDLGLTGSLQGTYMMDKYIGVLLGVKYEYGGLNNLGNNEKIKKITTSTINIYTGLKFEL